MAKATKDFHEAYGRTMESLGRLEGCLFYWFAAATGMLVHPPAR